MRLLTALVVAGSLGLLAGLTSAADASGNHGFVALDMAPLPGCCSLFTGVQDIAVDSMRDRIYVTDPGLRKVYILDRKGMLESEISFPLGFHPWPVAVDSDSGRVYVADNAGNRVAVIDAASNTIVKTIDLIFDSRNPNGLAIVPGEGTVAKYIAVANRGSGTLILIDAETNEVSGNYFLVGDEPRDPAADPRTGLVYVPARLGNTLSVVDPDSITGLPVHTIDLPGGPISAAVDPVHHRVYVALIDANSVAVIDSDSYEIIATVPVSLDPVDLAFDPSRGFVYVTNLNGGSVSVIDTETNTVAREVRNLGVGPRSIAVNPLTGLVYVGNFISLVTIFGDGPDTDGDTIGNGLDNCTAVYNWLARDFDRDGKGDVCDTDDDGDHVHDKHDLCPETLPPGAEVDRNGCATGQAVLDRRRSLGLL